MSKFYSKRRSIVVIFEVKNKFSVTLSIFFSMRLVKRAPKAQGIKVMFSLAIFTLEFIWCFHSLGTYILY